MSENSGGGAAEVGYFVLARHFGDIQRVLGYLSYVKGYLSLEKIIVVTSKAAASLADMYICVDEVIALQNNQLNDLGIYVKSGLCTHRNIYRDEEGFNGDVITEKYKGMVCKIGSTKMYWGIPIWIKDVSIKKRTRLNENTIFNMEKLIRLENIIPSNTLILCPYARSSSMLPNVVWEKFANAQGSQGFCVYTNVTENEKEIKGTRRLTVPFDILVALGKEGVIIVGVQSGAIDIVHRMDFGIYNINIHVLINPYDFKCVRDRKVNIPFDRKINTFHYSVYETNFDEVADKLCDIVSDIRKEKDSIQNDMSILETSKVKGN